MDVTRGNGGIEPRQETVPQETTAETVNVDRLKNVGVIKIRSLLTGANNSRNPGIIIETDHTSGHPGLVPGYGRPVLSPAMQQTIDDFSLEVDIGFEQEYVFRKVFSGQPKRIDVISDGIAVRFDVGNAHPPETGTDTLNNHLFEMTNDNDRFIYSAVGQVGESINKDWNVINLNETFRQSIGEGTQAIADTGGQYDGLSYRGV
jgi:hypothetical protein